MIDGYHLILASSVGKRDGMGLELTRSDGACVAEVFEEGDTGRRVVNLFEQDLPFDLVEWFLGEARSRL